MIIFKKKGEEIYLVTNYKVMFSSLNSNKNLTRVYPCNRLYLYALTSWISHSSRFYLIVRNPFERIVSFYKSKFLKAEKNRLWMLENENGNWQVCTEYFFPYLDLNTKTEPTEISKKLMDTKFEKVISILPKVFMMDGHMTPQYHSLNFSFKKYGCRFSIPIKYERIFKLENMQDLRKMEEIFDIDLVTKKNNTDAISNNVTWNDDSINIVANLYEKDIIKFNYKQVPDC